jgi:hypothetical protein
MSIDDEIAVQDRYNIIRRECPNLSPRWAMRLARFDVAMDGIDLDHDYSGAVAAREESEHAHADEPEGR